MHKLFFYLSLFFLCQLSYAQEVVSKVISGKLEAPIWKLPNFNEGAESYFSHDNKKMILSARFKKSAAFHTYVVGKDGRNPVQINDKGEDACAFFFPDGKHIVYTSTKDHPGMPKGNWSRPAEYPQGAELYIADHKGKQIRRLTNNKYYDAEVSVSPDGETILFTRQINGALDLWTIKRDGSGERQLTHTKDLQEGGSFFMPNGNEIVYRAWLRKDDASRKKPMDLYIIGINGENNRRLTNDGETNWAPYPAPDGKHILFSKILPPRNYEIFLLNIKTKKQTRLTYNDGFDGFPSISPDGKLLSFSSNRSDAKRAWNLSVYLMDVSKYSLSGK